MAVNAAMRYALPNLSRVNTMKVTFKVEILSVSSDLATVNMDHPKELK